MASLGRPTRENVATTRDDNATLLQSMLLTNNDFLHQNIREAAEKWLGSHSNNKELLIASLYQKALGRQPTKKERNLIFEQLSENPTIEEVSDLIWSVILLPEFQFL